MGELVDPGDSKSSAERRPGSSPGGGTKRYCIKNEPSRAHLHLESRIWNLEMLKPRYLP